MRIYLDNAATSPVDPRVFEAMTPYFTHHFGNPSSTHSHGREARAAIELSRKKIAGLLGVSPSEIFFTSGGTEADNTALAGLVSSYPVHTCITTPIEHHAVLHTLSYLEKNHNLKVLFLDVDGDGTFSFDQLEKLLRENDHALVSLMHANNEIGNVYDLARAGELCREYKALFHSDTVQSLGKIPIELKKIHIHSIAGSAHKFHGPKGAGFMYVKNTNKIQPLLHGGGQERDVRSGTENVPGIVGLAKALEIAIEGMNDDIQYIADLKSEMIAGLNLKIPGISYNGLSAHPGKSLHTILSASFPRSDKQELPLFQLDLLGIAVSGGSACASGALTGSHVLNALHADPDRTTVRFSFSKYNTPREIQVAIEALSTMV